MSGAARHATVNYYTQSDLSLEEIGRAGMAECS